MRCCVEYTSRCFNYCVKQYSDITETYQQPLCWEVLPYERAARLSNSYSEVHVASYIYIAREAGGKSRGLASLRAVLCTEHEALAETESSAYCFWEIVFCQHCTFFLYP